MASRKTKQKLMKRRIGYVARVFACASFLILTIIGVSSLVRAMSLETIANENGIPASWKAASLGEPDSITLPIIYWDQKADSCENPNRQFEWTECSRYRTHGVLRGIVKPWLGADRLPIPAFSDSESSWQALHDALSINVIGHDPVQKTDNFYRWFHEVPGLSRRINGRTVTFYRTGKGTYVYGGQDIYPIDDVAGIDASDVQLHDWKGNLHNFNFTAHLGFSIKVEASGNERFEFSGDDDVWVFLNNQLVLDIGGLHGPISGWFQINPDGTVTTFVEKNNNLDIRTGEWVECMRVRDGVYADDPTCIGPYNEKIRENFIDITTKNVDLGLKPNDVVNLDFFYAERSTDGSNTKITINHMNWPISADSDITGTVVGQIENTENNLVQFDTSITNRDPENPLILERLAAYIQETTPETQAEGFLPLSGSTLYYTTTPEDESSWQLVDISAPSGTTSGFNLTNPITMTPAGTPGDTLYFRYFTETTGPTGKMTSTISYYTTLNGLAGVTYDRDTVTYEKSTVEEPPVDPTPTDPEEPNEPEPTNPVNPEEPVEPNEPDAPIIPTPSEPDIPLPPALPVIPSRPSSDIIDGELAYLAPLGEIAYVPNTGIISNAVAAVFEVSFAEVILSQGVVMVVLLIFAASFATWFSFRKYMAMDFSVRSTVKKNHPKMVASKKSRKTKK